MTFSLKIRIQISELQRFYWLIFYFFLFIDVFLDKTFQKLKHKWFGPRCTAPQVNLNDLLNMAGGGVLDTQRSVTVQPSERYQELSNWD